MTASPATMLMLQPPAIRLLISIYLREDRDQFSPPLASLNRQQHTKAALSMILAHYKSRVCLMRALQLMMFLVKAWLSY